MCSLATTDDHKLSRCSLVKNSAYKLSLCTFYLSGHFRLLSIPLLFLFHLKSQMFLILYCFLFFAYLGQGRWRSRGIPPAVASRVALKPKNIMPTACHTLVGNLAFKSLVSKRTSKGKGGSLCN